MKTVLHNLGEPQLWGSWPEGWKLRFNRRNVPMEEGSRGAMAPASAVGTEMAASAASGGSSSCPSVDMMQKSSEQCRGHQCSEWLSYYYLELSLRADNS